MCSMPRSQKIPEAFPLRHTLDPLGCPTTHVDSIAQLKYGSSFFLKKKPGLFEIKNNNETNKTPKLNFKLIKTKIKLKLNSNFNVKI